MSAVKGKLTTCDRCGDTTFVKLKGVNYCDGGYTKVDEFEPEPESWLYTSILFYQYLCPKCKEELRLMLIEFYKDSPRMIEEINSRLLPKR